MALERDCRQNISIHGLRVEPDEYLLRRFFYCREISIHGLRVEPDCRLSIIINAPERFQSTGSVWSPTLLAFLAYLHHLFQSTGSVWSPTVNGGSGSEVEEISIHGLRVEPDFSRNVTARKAKEFQSTGSVWSPTFSEIA